MTHYQQTIKEIVGDAAEPHLVEAWMRLECDTLDWLDRGRFESEAWIGVECVKADPTGSEELARSLGCSK